MTEQEFNEAFGNKKAMLVRKENDEKKGETLLTSLKSRKSGKFEVVELSRGWYWAAIKDRLGWSSGWTILYVEEDGSYEAADSGYNLNSSEFVLIAIDKPTLVPGEHS